MNKILKIMLVLFLCTTIVGCTSKLDEEQLREGTPLVIVLGKHANARMFTEIDKKDKLYQLINDSITVTDNGKGYDCYADVTIIVNDGYPTTEELKSDLSYSTKEYNTEFLNDNINKIKNQLKDEILSNQLIADDEETDLLAALSEAENAAKEKNNIYIYDTGITTSGYLNMNDVQNDIMNNKINDIVNRLSQEGAIPNLKGNSIIFEGIGNVTGTQTSYQSNNTYKRNLTGLWESILKKSGARIEGGIKFSKNVGKDMIYTEDEEGDIAYPYVSPVTVDIESLDGGKGVYKSSQLGFKAQSSEFRDGTTLAKKVIRDSQLNSLLNYVDHEKGLIYVVGSVAKTSANQNLKNDNIANERAQKVKDILVELGIPASRLKTIDAGTTNFSWRNADEFPNGKKNPNNQEENRVVAVIPDSKECDKAIQELKTAGYIQ